MQRIGFPVAGASPAGAKVLERVVRHVGGRDTFPGTSCAVQETQRDRQAILKEFLWIVITDTWNSVGNRISEPGLNFSEKQVFWGGIHQHGFCGGGLKRKKPLPGICPARALIEVCESPGGAIVRPQSRKWR